MSKLVFSKRIGGVVMKRLLLFCVCLFTWLCQLPFAYATHNRAGQITYEHVGGLTYRFTIRICTNEGSNVADRPELEIRYGDGQRDTVPRVSETFVPPIGTFNGSDNIYVALHTFPGPGTYNISVLDPNRNQGIENIVSSVNIPFCIQTQLVISPFFDNGNNSSVPEDFPCPAVGCVGKRYCYNSAAYDPDGDSLSYHLVPCLGEDCDPLNMPVVYQYPHQVGGGVITLDPESGSLCWDSPQVQGEYNIAVLIKEWRNGVFVGSVLRDIQLTITGFCNNDPPSLSNLTDTCIVAGSSLQFAVTASDPNTSNVVHINASGQPFNFSSSPATFNYVGSGTNPRTGLFNWNTNCSHIRNSSYQLFFIARDNHPSVPLSDIRTMRVKVIPPPVTGLTVSPQANTFVLNWDPSPCSNIRGYRIYRKNGSGGSPPGTCCDADTPLQMGYTLLATVNGVGTTTYTDNSALVIGESYCYVIVAYTVDGAVSCPSAEVCEELRKDVPVITHVSVGETDPANGIDTVRWFHPTELDTISNYPPPYFYRVLRYDGFGNPGTTVYTSPQSPLLHSTATEAILSNVNTQDIPHTYRAELYNVVGGVEQFIAPTNNASSIFLRISPNDNELLLSWQVNVPWTNTLYEVYRETPTGSGNFTLIGTSTGMSYLDTGLVNGQTYCYKIQSRGSYSAPEIPSPLLNWSQEACAAPIDMTPPCPPVLRIDADCFATQHTLIWTNPNNTCADDVMSYNLYYSPTDTGTFTLLHTFGSQFDTSFLHSDPVSVAGCYYITAVDSAQYGNESAASNVVCVDNCPEYVLPNVFSPNGDGQNDYFIPFPYRFVKSIELKIFNRWGQLLFSTEDPDIRWDGRNQENGQPVSEGVYFYTCRVYTIRLSGIEPVDLKGFIHLFRENGGPNQ